MFATLMRSSDKEKAEVTRTFLSMKGEVRLLPGMMVRTDNEEMRDGFIIRESSITIIIRCKESVGSMTVFNPLRRYKPDVSQVR